MALSAADEDARFALTGRAYLESHGIIALLTDALELAVEAGEADVPASLAQYFDRVARGTHVLFRPFAYVALTPYNRASFVSQFGQVYASLNAELELATADYVQLVRLLCPDFPLETIAAALAAGQGGASARAPVRAFVRGLEAVLRAHE